MKDDIKLSIHRILSDESKAKELLGKKKVRFIASDRSKQKHFVEMVRIINGWHILTIEDDLARVKHELEESKEASQSNLMSIIMNYIYADQTVPPLRELLQNSLDANAKRIDFLISATEVDFKGDKKSRITDIYAIDNGDGMSFINIVKDLLIPTISSKRRALLYRPEMAITKKEVEKIGVFGLGFFSFLGIMNKVYLLTRQKNSDYYFVIIDTPIFLQNVMNPDYEKMILKIPKEIVEVADLVDFLDAQKGLDTKSRLVCEDLFKRLGKRLKGTAVFGTEGNYERKDAVLSKPTEVINVIDYIANFVKFKKPSLKIYINKREVSIDTALRDFLTWGTKVTIERIQEISTEEDIYEIPRTIDVWAVETSSYPRFQVIQGGIPIEVKLSTSSWDRTETSLQTSKGKIVTISEISPEYKYGEQRITLIGGLGYHFIINCDWIDLNIGRDKILENASYELFKEMVGEAILKINYELLPTSIILETAATGVEPELVKKKKKETWLLFLSDIGLMDRLDAFYFYATYVLENNRFVELIRTHRKLRIFPLLFKKFILTEEVDILDIDTLLRFDSIYFIPSTRVLDDITKNTLRTMQEKGKVVNIDLSKGISRERDIYIRVVNVFADEIQKNNIETFWLDPKPRESYATAPVGLDINLQVITKVEYTDYVEQTQKPEKIYQEDNLIELTTVDLTIIQVCEQLINFIFQKYRELYNNIEKALTSYALAGLIDRKSKLNLTPDEKKEVVRFFSRTKKIEVKMVEVPKGTMAIWYPSRIDPFKQWQAGWLGINKKTETYVDMINLIDHELELMAYLSSMVAHEIAHEKSIKIISKYLLLKQSDEHYTPKYVNARELCQDLAGEYVADRVKETRLLVGEEKEPFEAYCKKCGYKMTYKGGLVWYCETCKESKTPPRAFMVKQLSVKAKKILKRK